MPPAGALHVVARKHLDGAVYASPIVARGTVLVATENDSVYGMGTGGRIRWRRHLGTPSPQSQRPCGNIDPLGITGTPVYSPRTGAAYVVTETGTGGVKHTLVALDARSGRVRWRRSVDFPGVETRAMQQRGALTVTGGRVWVPFGGLAGDCGGYKGRLVGVPLNGRGTAVRYTVPTTREAGMWQPSGPTVDALGRLLVAVGNGAAGPGDPYDHSDSVLQLSPRGRLQQFFAPSGWAQENAGDVDLGSIGPALVGTRWLVQAGKSDRVYVLRQGHLGGIGGQVSSASIAPAFGGTAVKGDVVYLPTTDGLRAVRVDSTGHLHVLWHASSSVIGSPVVGGGRVWSLDPYAGVLHSLSPSTGSTLAQVTVGPTSRFATPALYQDRILIPTLSGLTIVQE
jgi:outer membrane protein assembly factor BamB